MDQHWLEERIGLYSLLRTLYTYPLRESVLDTVARLELSPTSLLAPSLAQMQTCLQDDSSLPAALQALNTEMTRLLEGPGLTPAPPYASYYLHSGQLMGPATVAVRKVYLEWQILPEGESRIPDDHIALELGFLAFLAERAVADSTETEKILHGSHDFIRQHLLPWLPRFCVVLSNASNDPFFKALAVFTGAAVQADTNWLTAVLAENPSEAASVAPPL